ncbi:hypothetical protein [Candidatus Azobacteroides pseudotrichonymphae]|jgi:hypothetical protein|uniref:hypothetical protein n=1 Tax=Candidatus Azobacteroides pseudotrichonymphae TaxID=511435 RepID=UPI0003112556|nr:hypothetical protein [Candidatus Azobacteroides pseudotrichonymphae]
MQWFWRRIRGWKKEFWHKYDEKSGEEKFIAIYATIYQALKLIIGIPIWFLAITWEIHPILEEMGTGFGVAFIANIVLYIWSTWILFIPNL